MKELSCEEIRQAVHGRWLRPGRTVGGDAPPGAPATVRGVTTDSRAVREGELFIALRGDRFDGHDYLAQAIRGGAAAALVRRDYVVPADAPAAPGGLIAVEDTERALAQLASYHRGLCAAKVVAVTGSNGKTTVKRMIHHILSGRLAGSCSPKSYNNRIGVPLTLLAAGAADDYVVCEVGTGAPGEVAALGRQCRPNVAVITSLGATHLEGLGGVDGVAVEKASLLGELAPDGIGVVCGRSGAGEGAAALEKAIRAHGRPVIRFGESEDCQVRLTGYEPPPAARTASRSGGCRFEVNGHLRVELPAPGRHNAVNALAAMTVAQRFGVDLEEAGRALAGFEPAEMRLQAIPAGSVTVLNDAYNANPASMAAAADVLAEYGAAPATGPLLEAPPARRRVFVAGDMLELGGDSERLHRETGRRLARAGIEVVVGVGARGRWIAEGAAEAGARAEFFASTEAAAGGLPGILRAGDVVLVKGSRGMAMERLVAPIRSAFERGQGRKPSSGARKEVAR